MNWSKDKQAGNEASWTVRGGTLILKRVKYIVSNVLGMLGELMAL